jgi:aminopeptidase YwaD
VDVDRLLQALCGVDPDRRPGSPGNEQAVDLVADLLADLGWSVDCPRFPVVDWEGWPGALSVGSLTWPVAPSPYALGWHGSAPLHAVADEAQLDADHADAIVLLHGQLTAAPLTPKGYPFYGSERDDRVVARLEACGAVAVLAATGRAPDLAGSWDPFPLIEDGAFLIPTGNLTSKDGHAVLEHLAGVDAPSVDLRLPSRRWPSTARNVVARRGDHPARVVVVAHIDSKPGTPGAVDNASGVVALVRAAELLADAELDLTIELVAMNGEDYYAAAGEQHYLASTDLANVRLAVNIDGVGFRGSPTAISGYALPEGVAVPRLQGVVPGPSWPQSDHMLFAMAGRHAVALTTADAQTVLHTVAHSPRDTPDLVDLDVLEDTARAVAALVQHASAGWPAR